MAFSDRGIALGRSKREFSLRGLARNGGLLGKIELQGLLEVLVLDFCDRFLRKNVGAPTSRTPNPTECGFGGANS
jgi:hypothetical protein